LQPRLMKAFRNMAERGFRSNSSQFALLVEQEMNRQSESETAESCEVSPSALREALRFPE
jgi:hypothetical protein